MFLLNGCETAGVNKIKSVELHQQIFYGNINLNKSRLFEVKEPQDSTLTNCSIGFNITQFHNDLFRIDTANPLHLLTSIFETYFNLSLQPQPKPPD